MENGRTLFSIAISWNPIACVHQNGNITGYVIHYGSGAGDMKSVDAIDNSYTITELQPSTMYLIQVAGRNRAGPGVFGNKSASTLPCKWSW